MRTRRLSSFGLIVCIALPAAMVQAGTAKNSPRPSARSTSARSVAVGNSARGERVRKAAARKNWRNRGQQVMDAKRVRKIQAALIRESYLEGRANGVWDQRSKQAMARFQSDNRWQSKVVPDSRALIKLGLGPEYAGLINPDTASISFIPRRDKPAWGSSQR